MPSSSSKTPYCQTGLGPALCPEFPLIALFRFAGPLLVAVQPTVVSLTGYRKRFDNPAADAIQRYLLIDIGNVDVQPIDASGNEGDGQNDISPRGVLVLFPGGGGKLNLQPGQTNSGSTNFVVRTRYHFAAQQFIVAVVDAASDFLTLSEGLAGHRVSGKPYSTEYLQDLEALIKNLRIQFPGKPLWMVGTSRGTLSAARAAADLGPAPNGPDGVVLTSSLTGPSGAGDLSGVALEDIRVPTLIVSNKADQCSVTKPDDSKRLLKRLTGAPAAKYLELKGGKLPPLDISCNTMSAHGFFGTEEKTIDKIGDWIRSERGHSPLNNPFLRIH
jgi:pimeloyl-ACP methyl ester carboxylesterase